MPMVPRREMPSEYGPATGVKVTCDNCKEVLRSPIMPDAVECFVHCAPCGYDLCTGCLLADDEEFAQMADACAAPRPKVVLEGHPWEDERTPYTEGHLMR